MAEPKLSAEYATLLYKCATLRTGWPMEKEAVLPIVAAAWAVGKIGLGIWSLYSAASAVSNVVKGNYGAAAWDAAAAIPMLGNTGKTLSALSGFAKGTGMLAKGVGVAGKALKGGGMLGKAVAAGGRASKALGATPAGQQIGSLLAKGGEPLRAAGVGFRAYGKRPGMGPMAARWLGGSDWRTKTMIGWGAGLALGLPALSYAIPQAIEFFGGGGGDKKPYALPQETGIQGQRAYTAGSLQGRNISPPMLPPGVYNQQPGQTPGQSQFIGGYSE